MLRTNLPVFGQIPPRLPHHPHWHARQRLAAASTQKQILPIQGYKGRGHNWFRRKHNKSARLAPTPRPLAQQRRKVAYPAASTSQLNSENEFLGMLDASEIEAVLRQAQQCVCLPAGATEHRDPDLSV